MKLLAAWSLAAVLALAGCEGCKKTTPVTGDAAAVPFDAATFDDPGSRPNRYRYWNQSDFLGRFMVVVPMTFTKTDRRTCDRAECLAELDFEGDGITIRAYALPGTAERHSLEDDKKAVARQKERVTSEKKLEDGWSFHTISEDGRTYAYHHQVASFVSPIRIEIRGPMADKEDVDEIADRLVRELLISHRRPPAYCNDLPWTPPEARKTPQTWLGTLRVAPDVDPQAFGAAPYVLVLDTPVCGFMSRAVWELQVSGAEKTDLAPLVGKHVRAEGAFDVPQGPRDYRPIVSPLSLAVAEAKGP